MFAQIDAGQDLAFMLYFIYLHWVGGWRGGGVLLEWLANGFSMMIVPTESLHFQAGGSDNVIAVHQT